MGKYIWHQGRFQKNFRKIVFIERKKHLKCSRLKHRNHLYARLVIQKKPVHALWIYHNIKKPYKTVWRLLPVVTARKEINRMAINSKQKGARFERLLASKFREYGYTDSRRTAQYCGNTGDASDVVGLPGIHIEAKHQERMQLYDWIDQAKRDAAGTGNIPVVFHKKNNADILVSMRFEDFMEIYKEYDASQVLKAGGD